MKRIILIAACAAILPAAEKASLVVVEKIGGNVGFYNDAGKRVASVKVGTHPHEIVLSPDKRYAYVSDNGILWMQYAGEGGNTISIIDLQNQTKAGVIDLGNNRRPHGMDLDPKTNRLLSTTENPDGLVLIDLKTRKVMRRYDVKGEDPHMVLFGPDYKTAYVSNSTSNTIAVVNLESGAVKLIPTGKRPQGSALSNDRRMLFVTNADANTISLIDTAKNETVGVVKTSSGPARVAITPDGKTLVYNLQAGNAVGFADLASRKELKVVPIGGSPLSLTLSPDGKQAYAGIQDQDKVVVLSVADRKVVKTIATPKQSGPDPALALQ